MTFASFFFKKISAARSVSPLRFSQKKNSLQIECPVILNAIGIENTRLLYLFCFAESVASKGRCFISAKILDLASAPPKKISNMDPSLPPPGSLIGEFTCFYRCSIGFAGSQISRGPIELSADYNATLNDQRWKNTFEFRDRVFTHTSNSLL